MHRTSFNVGNNLLLRCIAFKSEATQIYFRRRHSNLGGHTDGLVMFACSSDTSAGQSS